MLNFKVLIPCDPVQYLNYEYGGIKNWITPKKKNYKWSNLDKQTWNWTEKEWVHAIKFYNKKIGFDKNQTLKFVNQYLKAPNKVKTIPDDDIFDDTEVTYLLV